MNGSRASNQTFPYHFHATIAGPSDRPTLVLLHGFMGNGENFREAIATLGDRFRTIAVDLPGHGQTRVFGGRRHYTIAETARGLVSWLDRLHIQRCFLYGYSMGGRLALYLAVDYPDRFPKVVLESASPGLKTAAERSRRRQRDRALAAQLETVELSSFLTDWYRQPLFASLRSHPDFPRLLAARSRNSPAELATCLRYMGTGNQPSLWPHLADCGASLLLLVGECDDKFVAINREMARSCPVARLAIVPNAGHTVHFENLRDWTTAVVRFLSPEVDALPI